MSELGIFDDIIKNDPNEEEWEDTGGGFADIPIGKWFLLRAAPASSGAASAVEPPNDDWKTWYSIMLGFEAIGAEEGVEQANYGGFFHRFYPDTQDTPGEPSGKLKGLVNKLFAAGLPKGSEERAAKAREVMNSTVKEFGIDPEDTENYPTLAVFMAAVMTAAMGARQPTILAKTWLRKAREFTDSEGHKRMSKERVEIGTFTDDTPENREKLGIEVWPTGEEDVAV